MKYSGKTKMAWVLTAAVSLQGLLAPVSSRADVWEEEEIFLLQDMNEAAKEATKGAAPRATPADMATPSAAVFAAAYANSTGDLWEGWHGDMGFPGDGTSQCPYQIGSLAELMGFSEAVAAGESFAGEYFELTADIDLGGIDVNQGNWNPIGWYQNAADLSGDLAHPFSGHFDGAGNRITGLKIINPARNLKNIGLFGVIDGGTVKNLIVEGEDIYGTENVGVLAGSIRGNAVISDITVSGYVRSEEDAGGVAGEITGKTDLACVENCRADGIAIYSGGTDGYVGGIGGNVQKAWLVDNVVITQDGDYNRIHGKGYVGGIAGRMNLTQIYNSYVNGTIGGNASRAAGGIVGKYESGSLVLARMAGDISNTNNGAASREGTFVGTRDARNSFTYGTERTSNLSYLFANSSAKAKQVFGSTIDGDNSFTKSAHIGYWTDNERKYVTVAGKTETACGDRYFYEELEDAVRYIVTQKLNREFTAGGYGEGLPFRLDHFAPGYMGEPVRGYLISVPRIDARNANGTQDTDVASLTAVPAENTYYRAIDREHAAAVTPGAVVTVLTAPKNTGENRYQMVVKAGEAGGVEPPVYTDEDGMPAPMQYVNGGSYTFLMPECDTELNVKYVKVTTTVQVDPAETTISVTHTRSGDRKNPETVTEVRNEQGTLIARYIGGSPDQTVEVQPVLIHASCNGAGSTVDKTVLWSVDDTDLLTNTSESGYTLADARILPNIQSSFIQNILQKEIRAQADNRYQDKIRNTIYTRPAVVTAATNPDTSVDQRSAYGNCRVNVTFQILDHTTLRVDAMSLNRSEMTCTITRKLTGDRRQPKEEFLVEALPVLTATLNPEQPFFKNVSWSDRESGKIIRLTPSGVNTQDCQVTVNCDVNGKDHPAWIRNIILTDEEQKKQDPYGKQTGTGNCSERITAVSEDQTNGHITATCDVTILFVTADETVIHPEKVELTPLRVERTLELRRTGRGTYAQEEATGMDPLSFHAAVFPNLPDQLSYQPYNRKVVWSISDPDTAVIDQNGTVTIRKDSNWIRESLMQPPYDAEKVLQVTAVTQDQKLVCSAQVCLKLQVTGRLSAGSSGGSGGSGGGGGSSSGGGSSQSSASTAAGVTGPAAGTAGSGQLPAYVVDGTWEKNEQGIWTFTDGTRTFANEWAALKNPYANLAAGQSAFDWFRFGADGSLVTGWFTDEDGKIYYLNPISDGTLGRMITGWHWIDSKCYYFQEISDGSRGSLAVNTRTPDGYSVNERGEWTVDQVVQIQNGTGSGEKDTEGNSVVKH